jgi:GT2 family glycosyltransferase
MKIAVVIATVNRAEELGQLLRCLERQTLAPAAIVISASAAQDLCPDIPAHVRVVIGAPGVCMQRNRGLDLVLPDSDIVLFFDDDFVPARESLQAIADLFAANPDIVSATGLVLEDGVGNGGLSFEAAMNTINAYEAAPRPPIETHPMLGAYGCNMAFRAAAIGALRFDEKLPLTGWQEDIDFAVRLSARGRMVKTTAFAGVHRGVSKGRSSGVRLGFSQIVNPVYLTRKGSMPALKAFVLITRNLLANHIKSLRPEPYIDRRGRLYGNWVGIMHLATGRADPARMLRY